MIELIKQQQIKEDDWGWIQMRSPVLYHQPYGTLAVFTDGFMHPGKGFDMHPHRNIEIVSVILEGEVTHQDSTGNITKMPAGSVQCISAGTGIYHAEHTTSPATVRMYQIWFIPQQLNVQPAYSRLSFQDSIQKNNLHLIVANTTAHNMLTMNANGSIYMATFDTNHKVEYPLQKDRKLFVFVAEGSLQIADKTLNRQDHARIWDITTVPLEAMTDTQFIVIEVPIADQRLQ